MKTAIHWFRRDLRITDNTALSVAADKAAQVLPVYIVSSWKKTHRWTGAHRQQFLCESLKALEKNLSAIGGRLVIREGDPVAALKELVRESGAEAISFNRDPDPHGRKVEEDLVRLGEELGVEIVACKDVCIHEREEVLNSSGNPFRVFTPYSKAWQKLPLPEVGGKLRALKSPGKISSLPLPTLRHWGLVAEGEILAGGEEAARERLTAFLRKGLASYGEQRNIPAGQTTSRLSQDLRFGLLSIREVFVRCEKEGAKLPAKGRASAQTFLGELIWREFYMQVLWHFPNVLEEEFNPKFRKMPWPGKGADFQRWCDGETGFPLVDAAMRQLKQTGFMHNRMRMITAMFLTKDLHLDWRLGESWFLQQLVDGEIASNNGGWQWSAGTGADAAPYFRIQNPWTQTERYDPEGKYIKEWVPELREVPAKRFFAPPLDGTTLAKGYPTPIVDHREAREKTLAMFAKQKRRMAA